MELNNHELMNITGGAKNIAWTTLGLIVGGAITVIIGIIDGYKRPLPCNK